MKRSDKKMPYDNDGFPASGNTYFEVSKENYFKILAVLKKDYEKELNEMLKPKRTIAYVEPLSERDILGILTMFDLNSKFANVKAGDIDGLRTSFKKFIEGSKNNTKLKKYLSDEGILERASTLKKKKIETTTIVHNKIKKVMNFALEKYLNIK